MVSTTDMDSIEATGEAFSLRSSCTFGLGPGAPST